MKNIQALVFDYDGILADSVAAHTQARMQAFVDSGYGEIDLSTHAEAHRHGSTPSEIIGWILKYEGIVSSGSDDFTDKTIKVVVDRKNEIFFAISSAGLDAIPGSIEFVHKALSIYGVANLAIATTASYAREVQPFLERHGLEKAFSVVVAKEQTPDGQFKPHPYVYTEAVKRLGLGGMPDCAAAFEDSPRGVRSAISAGLYVIGITTTHNPKDLSEANQVVTDYSSLNGLI